jgi:hypothetical protein
MGLMILGYGFFAQPDLRRTFTLPLSVIVLPDTNLFQKYNFNDAEYQLTTVLADHPHTFAPGFVDPLSDIYRAHLIDMTPNLNFSQHYALRGWNFTREPGFIRDMGYTTLLILPETWDMLPPADRAKLDDPARYTLTQIIGDYRLYTVVGMQREVYAAYDANEVVIFTRGEGTLEIYGLDDNREGVRLGRIEQTMLTEGENQIETQNDWQIAANCDANQCNLALMSPEGQLLPINTFAKIQSSEKRTI